jgi:hypothetical protein
MGVCALRFWLLLLPADHLIAVVLHGEGLEGGLDEAATQTEDEMQGRLL